MATLHVRVVVLIIESTLGKHSVVLINQLDFAHDWVAVVHHDPAETSPDLLPSPVLCFVSMCRGNWRNLKNVYWSFCHESHLNNIHFC